MRPLMESHARKKSPFQWYTRILKTNSLSRIWASWTICKGRLVLEVCRRSTLVDNHKWDQVKDLLPTTEFIELSISQLNNYHKVLGRCSNPQVKAKAMELTFTLPWASLMTNSKWASDSEATWINLVVPPVQCLCIVKGALSQCLKALEGICHFKTMPTFDWLTNKFSF